MLLFGFFVFITINAQEATFTLTDLISNDKSGHKNSTLVFPEENNYTIYSIEKENSHIYSPEKVSIIRYKNLNDIETKIKFDLPKRDQAVATLLDVIETKNKLYFFSYLARKKDKKNVLYCQIYDNETHQVLEEKELYVLPIEKVNNSGFFNVKISEDENKIAVLIQKPYVKKTKEKIDVLILNANLDLLSKEGFTLDFDSEKVYHEALFISNSGVISIVKKTDVKKKNPITTVLTIRDKQIEKQQISKKEFYISDNKVITVNDKQYLVGFSTNNAKPIASFGGPKEKGFFIFNITEKKLLKSEAWAPHMVKRVIGKGIVNLKVKDVLVFDDNIYLIGDCMSMKTEEIEGKNFEYNYKYNFGPGIIIKLNTNGDVLYQSYLRYDEPYMNEHHVLGSFFPYLSSNGQLQILANQKEYLLKGKKIVTGYSNINEKIPVLHKFDDKGEITTIAFWDDRIGGKSSLISFAPSKTIQLNDTTFYIYTRGSEDIRYGKLILK